jgi:hypothetical protein
MITTLEHLKTSLQVDRGSPEAEWKIVQSCLGENLVNQEGILFWLFKEFKGYVDTRDRAGWLLWQKAHDRVWIAISELVDSSDPDDRDVALGILKKIDSAPAKHLAQKLTNDRYAYIAETAKAFVNSK